MANPILGQLNVAEVNVFVTEKWKESAAVFGGIRYVFSDEDDEDPPPRM